MKSIQIRFGDHFDTRPAQEKSFDEMFQSVNPMFSFSKRVWKPQMDIFETRLEIVIQADISGVKKEDILIEISDKAVRISGNRRNNHCERTATYRLAEIQFGPFERVLYLPCVIDVNKVSAKVSDGFLRLVLGKALQAQQKFL